MPEIVIKTIYLMEVVPDVPLRRSRDPVYDAVFKQFLDGSDDKVRIKIDGKSPGATAQCLRYRASGEGIDIHLRGDFVYLDKNQSSKEV